MGFYINPTDGRTKEQWLRESVNNPMDMGHIAPRWSEVPAGKLPVCLVDNGPFTAAGIAFNERELDAFKQPDDRRPKMWYFVPIEKLLEVEPTLKTELLLG